MAKHSRHKPPATCEIAGKIVVEDRRHLEHHARNFSRDLNARGLLAPSFYGYRCPGCHYWHLTKEAQFAGQVNFLVLEAASEPLQMWAITGEAPTVPLH